MWFYTSCKIKFLSKSGCMDLYRNIKSAYVLIYDLSKHFSNELMVSVTGSKFHTSNMTIL